MSMDKIAWPDVMEFYVNICFENFSLKDSKYISPRAVFFDA